MPALTLAPGRLSLADLQLIHDGAPELRLDASAGRGLASLPAPPSCSARRGGSEAVYGVNTGFGKLASTRIGEAALENLALNLIRSHCVGVGEPLSPPVVRLMLALRRQAGARIFGRAPRGDRQPGGGSTHAGLIPYVQSQGSVGASGDLAPLAHMTLALIGEGRRDAAGRPAQ